MSVAIRLSRVGTKHVPFFRIVVVDSRKKRDGAVIENLGTYDARKTSLVQFKPERYEEWLKKGAQPSDTAKKVYRLFKKQAASAPVEKTVKAPSQKKAEAKAVESAPTTEKNTESNE